MVPRPPPPPNRYSWKENNSKVWGADVIPFMRLRESFGITFQKMCQELRLLTS